jgi:hypothetical protein
MLNCTIRNAFFGVFGEDLDIAAHNNVISNLYSAFFISGQINGMGNDRLVDITQNTIDTAQSYGISMRSCSPTLLTNIDDNDITFGLTTFIPSAATTHQGIELDNYAQIAENEAIISNNHVYLSYANDDPDFIGYELRNIINVHLNSNFANYRGASINARDGISIDNSQYIHIMGNTLIGGGDDTPEAQGIFSSKMPHSLLCCNTIDSVSNGIHFSDANNMSLIRGTTFNGPFSSNALFFDETMTGITQKFPGNDWTGVSDVDARFAGNDPTETTNNPFIVSTDGLPFHPDDPIVELTQGWFRRDDGDEYLCEENLNCDDLPDFGISCNDYPYDTLLLSHGYEGEHGEGLTWQARKHVLQSLFRDPDFGCDSSLVESFKSSHQNSTLGKLARLANSMSDVFQRSPSLDSQLRELDTIMQVEMHEIMVADSMFETENVDEEYWEEIRVGHLEDFMIAFEDYSELIAGHREVILDSLPSLVSFLSGITPGNIRDSNDVFVSGFYLNHLLNPEDTVTSADSNWLLSIADQCPLDGGDAVYRARSILRGLDIDYYNPGVNCTDMTGLRSKYKNPENKEREIRFWPNPSNGQVYIQIPKSKELIDYDLSIRNIDGKQILYRN